MFFTFDASAQGWSTGSGEFTWINTDGVVLGCLFAEGGTSPTSFIAFDPVMAFIGDPYSCYVKVTATAPEATPANNVTFRIQTDNSELEHEFACGGVLGYDSGWIRINAEIEVEGEVGSISVSIPDTLDATVHLYVDNIYFLQSDEVESGYTRSAGGVPGAVAI